ncbi:hypothetical protein CC1G_02751 [Coprinopsis cinerea okayama7|uniref:F-box domain-containing protein n=1 Tax=Coprinopsis cinerea (strain Okayama-7 / 130 / ATCC MYA-4618 / FGSC 9003) TaxID=240176 RepID=A8MZU6_COPC7|nr:hypothetical protein CC1G_02751 [Coprinopsis cinerea okayama7\|eukprot:XP_001828170.2 hypothetical protein CC1G_02751 [Coprinopsis cinerea okayama7\
MSQPPTNPVSEKTGLWWIDGQRFSPLYTVLPAEIRILIFKFTLAKDVDLKNLYPFEAFYYRPGCAGPMRADLGLLRTCRRVYREAKDLVWDPSTGNCEETFWWGGTIHRPKECRSYLHRNRSWEGTSSTILTRPYTESQWSRMTSIHLYMEAHCCTTPVFTGFFARLAHLRPRVIRITFRRTDWIGWEAVSGGLSLGTDVPWYHDDAQATGAIPNSVEAIILELETVEWRSDEVDDVITMMFDHSSRCRWKREDGRYLVLDRQAGVKQWDWMGTSRPGYVGYKSQPLEFQTQYTVKVLMFTLRY